MRKLRITIDATVSEGAMIEADRFGKRILSATLDFAAEAKGERVEVKSAGFADPLELSLDLTKPHAPQAPEAP